MILLTILGVAAAILLVHMLEGALKAAAVVLLACIAVVFTCDFFNVDWRPLVANQARTARHVVKTHERELRGL